MSKKECGNCIHYNICDPYVSPKESFPEVKGGCQAFKDKSLFVELPCAIGITLYFLYNRPYAYKPDLTPKIYKTNEWYFEFDEKEIAICPRMIHGLNGNYYYHLGKTVFLTKEDAERKLEVGE